MTMRHDETDTSGRSALQREAGDPSVTISDAHSGRSPLSVLVVTQSRVNGVVVERIVERTGMRGLVLTPDEACRSFETLRPAIVVLDGGPGNRDCTPLYPLLTATRRAAGSGPAVLMLTTGITSPDKLGILSIVDTTVAKPITPDRLQPILAGLRDSAARTA